MSNDRPPVSAVYRGARSSFVDLASGLSDDHWATAVPCLPGWDVHDVLSHLVGVCEDSLAGRTEGAPGDAWTAAQVDRNRASTPTDLLKRWDSLATDFETMLDSSGGIRVAFDCVAHEHDVRHALNRPGNRDSAVLEVAAAGLTRFDHPFPVTVIAMPSESESDNTESLDTGAQPSGVELHGVSGFELFRSRLGRRSARQARAYSWTGADEQVAAVLADWFIFGPADHDIVE